MDKLEKIAATLIWDICKLSPEMGNAVMDVIGEEGYHNVMTMHFKKKKYTIREIFDTLSDRQKQVLYILIEKACSEKDLEIERWKNLYNCAKLQLNKEDIYEQNQIDG